MMQIKVSAPAVAATKPVALHKRVKSAVASVVVSGALLAAAPALATPDLALGEEVFTANCATCHSGGKNVLIPYKTLEKDAIAQYLDGGFNVNAMVSQIINGKGQMPAWKDVLDDDEIDAVANYVYATASASAW